VIIALFKRQCDELIAQINKQVEDNEEFSKATLEEEDESRKISLQKILMKDRDTIELAKIYMGYALKLYHLRKHMWVKNSSEQTELAKQELDGIISVGFVEDAGE
jgi:hypothetical protein